MRPVTIPILIILWVALATVAAAGPPRPSPDAAAAGLGINIPLAARLVGSGNTLYVTSIDVSNHSTSTVQVDFYFDGVNSATQAPVTITGSVSLTGLVRQGDARLRARSNVHFEDFISALADAQMLPAEAREQGVIGSVLFVFNNLSKSGQAAVTARFKNDLAGGTVGVALRGREMTNSEPQRLVVAVRDTRGNARGEAQVYPNLFINHTGLTPAGQGDTSLVTVELTAVSNSTGQGIGSPVNVTIASGNTALVGSLLQALQVPAGDDTILVYARVTSGSAAIHGIVSQVDATTRDGSVFEMSRADF
jgi:hypothetical protein